MSDIADKANDQMQPILDAGIKHICNQSQIDINGTGKCLVCKNPVTPVIIKDAEYIPRWCSTNCRDGIDDE